MISGENTGNYCHKCDGESRHLIPFLAAGDTIQYICAACMERDEKRVYTKPMWRRGRPAR